MREKKNTERLTNNNDNYCIGKKTNNNLLMAV